jgi:hypothetical protein
MSGQQNPSDLIRRAMEAGDLVFGLGPRGGAEETARAIVEALGPQWQPIETAPRDGTKFDLWIERDSYRVTDAYWSDLQGWWCTDGDYGPEEPLPLAIVPAPTHWMPLPAPPAGPGHE